MLTYWVLQTRKLFVEPNLNKNYFLSGFFQTLQDGLKHGCLFYVSFDCQNNSWWYSKYWYVDSFLEACNTYFEGAGDYFSIVKFPNPLNDKPDFRTSYRHKAKTKKASATPMLYVVFIETGSLYIRCTFFFFICSDLLYSWFYIYP